MLLVIEVRLFYSTAPAGCHHSFQLYNHDIMLYVYISQHLLKTLVLVQLVWMLEGREGGVWMARYAG